MGGCGRIGKRHDYKFGEGGVGIKSYQSSVVCVCTCCRYCSYFQNHALLHELILAIGYFCVLNNDNQVYMQKSIIILFTGAIIIVASFLFVLVCILFCNSQPVCTSVVVLTVMHSLLQAPPSLSHDNILSRFNKKFSPESLVVVCYIPLTKLTLPSNGLSTPTVVYMY